MNSLNFYNEYMTAMEQAKSREFGQNIGFVPSLKKNLTPDNIKDIISSVLFSKTLFTKEINDDIIKNKMQQYIYIVKPHEHIPYEKMGYSKNSDIYSFVRVKFAYDQKTKELYVHDAYSILLHINLYIYWALVNNKPILPSCYEDIKFLDNISDELFMGYLNIYPNSIKNGKPEIEFGGKSYDYTRSIETPKDLYENFGISR